MSHKIIEAARGFGISLSESDGKQINDFLGITDKRKNLSNEQRLLVQQVCELISQGKSVESAIALAGSNDASVSEGFVEPSTESEATDEVDLNLIIESQANRAADAALMSLPDLAMSEIEGIRAAFIRQFRKRIRERLQSADYMSALVTTIDSQVQLPAADTNNNAVVTNGRSNSEG
ncbi:MAG: hypothetical protein AAFQ14_05170 [Cyanobacteria bacterium J06621_12]